MKMFCPNCGSEVDPLTGVVSGDHVLCASCGSVAASPAPVAYAAVAPAGYVVTPAPVTDAYPAAPSPVGTRGGALWVGAAFLVQIALSAYWLNALMHNDYSMLGPLTVLLWPFVMWTCVATLRGSVRTGTWVTVAIAAALGNALTPSITGFLLNGSSFGTSIMSLAIGFGSVVPLMLAALAVEPLAKRLIGSGWSRRMAWTVMGGAMYGAGGLLVVAFDSVQSGASTLSAATFYPLLLSLAGVLLVIQVMPSLRPGPIRSAVPTRWR
jgi:hypothetical protein